MSQGENEGFNVDRLVVQFDRALRTLTGGRTAARVSPSREVPQVELSDEERQHAAGLMRVNHTGEVCAQALYEGQALTARSDAARQALLNAAGEETDHLVWCEGRLHELQAQPSVLNPLFYGVSLALGAVAGLAGDKVSMGFVEATEDQVCKHLDEHLESLPRQDTPSRAIVAAMREDEAGHRAAALEKGGVEFPLPVKQVMTLLSKVMTRTTYRI